MKNSLLVFAIVLGMGALGCGGVEAECESLCEWAEDECLVDMPSDCVAECEEAYDDADDECQESFDELAECLEEDDSCDTTSDCVGEAVNFDEDCGSDFDF